MPRHDVTKRDHVLKTREGATLQMAGDQHCHGEHWFCNSISGSELYTFAAVPCNGAIVPETRVMAPATAQ